MANITLLGASYTDVPAVDLPQTGGGTVRFYENGGGTPAISVVDTTDSHGGTVRTITALDISDSTLTTADQLAQGITGYNKLGVKLTGTGGGTPSATQHTIYFEFSDSTDTTITAYYDSTFISDAITATTPKTYGGKTVTLAQLDGVTWYNPADIPLNTQLVDYTAVKVGYIIDGTDGGEVANEAGFASDYIVIDPTMTFTYVGYEWWDAAFYDASKVFISGFTQNSYADSIENIYAHGTLTPSRIPSNAMYIRLTSYPAGQASSTTMSLIRTA